MIVEMDIDSHGNAQGHDSLTTGNPQQPSRAEATHRTNGGDNERTKSNEPRPQPMLGSMQHEEVQIENIMGKPESGWEGELEVGTSSTLAQRKGKKPTTWSLRK
jgi:hypothetical protein